MKIDNKRIKEVLVVLLIYALILFPFLITIVLSVPVSDDFSMAGQIGDHILIDSIKRTAFFYMHWGGDSVLFFFQFLLNPLCYAQYNGTGHAVGIELCIFLILFIFLLHISIGKIILFFAGVEKRRTKTVLSVLFVFAFLNSGLYPEIYYWYVGNSYVWGVIMALLCLLCIIRYFESPNRGRFIMLCLMGFVACFPYQLAVWLGFIYLLAVFRSGRYNKIFSYIPLVFMVIGGCISVLAPGNFSRQGATDATISLSGSLLYAVQAEIKLLTDVHTTPVFIVLLIVALIVGYRYGEEYKYNIPAMIAMEFISEFGVIFPITLGYSSDNLPNRAFFYSRFVLYLWAFLNAMIIGRFIKKHFTVPYIPKGIPVLACLLLFVIYEVQYIPEGHIRIYELPIVRTALNIESSLNVSRKYRDIYRTISESDEKDVVVYMNMSSKDSDNVLYGPRLEQDPNFWVNGTVARYYNKDSVSVIIYEE